ncbi:MAG: tryptophan synthase subunit alpha [Bradymonadia bacterium]
MMTAGAQHIEAAIRRRHESGQPALAAFFTAGYPAGDDLAETFQTTLARIGEVADVVEIGVPFSDPMADGMTLQRAAHSALEAGVTLRWILAQLKARPSRDTPVVLMSYLNPLFSLGFEALAAEAAEAGVDGFIVPDLPLEESDEMLAALKPHGLALIQLVSPLTPADRAARIAESSGGFLYAVTAPGTTGGQLQAGGDLLGYLDTLRAKSPVPIMAGFGIRTSAQVDQLAPHAHGVIVGTALVETLESGADPRPMLESLRPGLHGVAVSK